MVRAAVQVSQASLERPGSAPAPFSACPQAEPRPEAQKRTRHVCRARVRGCERGGGWARAGGRAHASDSAKRACVSGRWAQGAHWARALACRASLFTARPCTQGVRRRASALGDNQGRSAMEGALRHSVCSPSPVSGHPVRQSPMAPDSRTINLRPSAITSGSVYNRPETPSMPGLLRLFRAACDSTSSIDVTRSMRVSMYGTTCAWCAKRTFAPGYLDCNRIVSWNMRCSVPN